MQVARAGYCILHKIEGRQDKTLFSSFPTHRDRLTQIRVYKRRILS